MERKKMTLLGGGVSAPAPEEHIIQRSMAGMQPCLPVRNYKGQAEGACCCLGLG
jgi:hypothetical protein